MQDFFGLRHNKNDIFLWGFYDVEAIPYKTVYV